jgi:hypothetical protein
MDAVHMGGLLVAAHDTTAANGSNNNANNMANTSVTGDVNEGKHSNTSVKNKEGTTVGKKAMRAMPTAIVRVVGMRRRTVFRFEKIARIT